MLSISAPTSFALIFVMSKCQVAESAVQKLLNDIRIFKKKTVWTTKICKTGRGYNPGGCSSKFWGGSVPPGTESPYPISDQICNFRPYFRPKCAIFDSISDKISKSPTLFLIKMLKSIPFGRHIPTWFIYGSIHPLPGDTTTSEEVEEPSIDCGTTIRSVRKAQWSNYINCTTRKVKAINCLLCSIMIAKSKLFYSLIIYPSCSFMSKFHLQQSWTLIKNSEVESSGLSRIYMVYYFGYSGSVTSLSKFSWTLASPLSQVEILELWTHFLVGFASWKENYQTSKYNKWQWLRNILCSQMLHMVLLNIISVALFPVVRL